MSRHFSGIVGVAYAPFFPYLSTKPLYVSSMYGRITSHEIEKENIERKTWAMVTNTKIK